MKRLTVEDIRIAKPNYDEIDKPKGEVIVVWFIEWIKYSLEYGIADFGDFIPSKEDLAKFLDVSTATVQNSIHQVKNMGYFASKQSKGTYIIDFHSKDIKPQDELYRGTIAECKIKKIILDKKIKINEPILSIKEFSKLTDISQNTVRFALVNLAQKGYLEQIILKGNKHRWIYKKEIILSKEEISNGINDENFTLTHQLIEKIRNYIEKTYKQGEKILPNQALSNMFDVSIKTINDAMKVLNSKKIVLSRRGRYGTIYLGKNNISKNEFVSSEKKSSLISQRYIYAWQKTLTHLKKYIVENYKVGDKIAPIRKLASILNISPNTIRRALNELFENGYLVSQRGKFGGIYIMEMPELEQNKFKWIAINPDTIKNLK